MEFKYKGSNDSFTLQYLWSPIDQWLLKFFPLWMAPNVITLIAMVQLLIAHIWFVYQLPSNREIPINKAIIMGLSILIYQHLDNIDGKQARRTNSATAVGMIFDHGCDSLSSMLISIPMCLILGYHNYTLMIFLMYIMVFTIGFSAMWNQYSCGEFHFDRINPIDEGLPIYAVGFFLSPFVPFQNLNQFHIFGKYNQEIAILSGVLLIIQLYFMNRHILKKAIRSRPDVLSQLWLPIIVGFSLFILYQFGQNDLLQNQFYPIIYCTTLMWARNMIHMQVCFVVKQKFNPINASTIFYLGYNFVYLILKPNAKSYFTGTAIFHLLFLLKFVIEFFNQAKSILKIRIFHIPSRNQ